MEIKWGVCMYRLRKAKRSQHQLGVGRFFFFCFCTSERIFLERLREGERELWDGMGCNFFVDFFLVCLVVFCLLSTFFNLFFLKRERETEREGFFFFFDVFR